MAIDRRAVRAILVDGGGQLVLIKRTKPGQDPYWTAPGGGVKDTAAAPFDLAAEVDVFAAHLQYQLRTARNHQLLIADKTIINVLAYAWMLLGVEPGSIDAAVLDAMETFCRAWAPTYDVMFFTHDHYSQPNGSPKLVWSWPDSLRPSTPPTSRGRPRRALHQLR